MMPLALLFLLGGLGLIAWLVGRARALAFARPAALPHQYGTYVAIWALAPALLLYVAWLILADPVITGLALTDPAAQALPAAGYERTAILAEARSLAQGRGYGAFYDQSAQLAPVFARLRAQLGWIVTALCVLLAGAGGGYAYAALSPRLRARNGIDRGVMLALLAAALIAILTTGGIFVSLLYESVRFFRIVPITDFLFGTHWSPQVIAARDPGASLGAVPLFWGTFFIGAVIAMVVAVPLGLMSAVYLTQYARPATRRWMKPVLELLAGVPTVVYGYFAALTVGPAIRSVAAAAGIADASSESALAAGLVMGIMIVPFVSSMADDAFAAVPAAMRDGSLALGATASETIGRVLFPAALPGIVAGILLAVSRAIGETMIVVMAASGAATISLNPLDSATTVTKQIVDLLTGEATFDSPKTLAAFALGMTLFVVTFAFNIVALTVVKRYREAYE